MIVLWIAVLHGGNETETQEVIDNFACITTAPANAPIELG
jgi:hypothetical protein